MTGRAVILAALIALACALSSGTGDRGAAFAQTDFPGAYPAAKCAAFWLGWTDAARRLNYLREDPGDAVLAENFRKAALDEGADAAVLDAYLRRDRRDMRLMIEAAIFGDRSSSDIQDRLMKTCDDYARAHGF